MNLWKLYALEKIREELKTDKAAVIGGDSEVYETSHFVPKLFMQSVSAAVLVDSARFVCASDDRNPAKCSPLSSERERESASMGACVLSLASLRLCGCCHMLL